jgi:hypothetical protein
VKIAVGHTPLASRSVALRVTQAPDRRTKTQSLATLFRLSPFGPLPRAAPRWVPMPRTPSLSDTPAGRAPNRWARRPSHPAALARTEKPVMSCTSGGWS